MHFYLGACESYIDVYIYSAANSKTPDYFSEKRFLQNLPYLVSKKICMKSYCAPMHDGRFKIENERPADAD